MKWMPWPPLSSKKFEAKIVVQCLRGLPEKIKTSDGGDLREFSKLGVEVTWRGSGNLNNRIGFKRGGLKRNLTKDGLVNDDGFVEWNEEFVDVFDGCFRQWEVSFQVFDGLIHKRRDRVIATGSLNLAEFASVEQEKTPISIHLSEPNNVECSPILFVSLSLLELTQKSVTPLNGFEPSVLKSGLKKVKLFRVISAKKTCREEVDSVKTEGADYPFDTDSFDGSDGIDSEEIDYANSVKTSFGYETLAYANHVCGSSTEDRIYYKTKKDDDLNGSMIKRVETRILKKSVFPWRKRKSSFNDKKEPLLKRGGGEEGGDDIDFDRRMLTSSDDSSYGWHKSDDGSTTSRSSISEFGDDNFVIGKWVNKEITNRDGSMNLETQIFFASIDQRSQRASGESACTTIVATIADWFQNNRQQMPVKSELDTLIRNGSAEWRNLCENEIYRKKFPDKHFDLETVIQAKTRNFCVIPEMSFVGFFRPDRVDGGVFDFLDGVMSFDDIWDEISQNGSTRGNDVDPLVYIVSWNDHFFVLKVEKDAYFIIDTLGERLYEGCNQAYVLKFDQNTTIRRKSNGSVDRNNTIIRRKSKENVDQNNRSQQKSNENVDRNSSSDSENNNEDMMTWKGKESCKEYIKNFLAAIPLRELQTDVKKGLVSASSPILHHRLQIEFHYTKCL